MIDAVIAWVDGSDPEIAAKRARYAGGSGIEKLKDVAGATRFASNGEIRWCVRSINKYAPWIRKIFIITDGQTPPLDESRIPVEVIDHKVIFRGNEKFLPTFNSLAIETMAWRIPGLSEKFLYLNDDFILINPVRPEDFFLPDGRPIAWGYMRANWTAKAASVWEFIKRPMHPKVMFRDSMLQAAVLLGKHDFIRIQHVPHGMRRDVLERFFSANPDALKRNASYRFRSRDQFNPQELNYLLSNAEVRRHSPVLLYADPRSPLTPAKVSAAADKKFFCVNSLDSMADPDFVRAFVESRLS